MAATEHRRRRAGTAGDELPYFAGAAGSIPGALFAEKLIEKMPGMTRVYYCQLRLRGEREGVSRWSARSPTRNMAARSTRSSIATATITARPWRRCRRAVRTSATRNTDPSRPASSACPTAWNTAPRHEWDASQGSYGEWAANQIEEVILREGPDTVGALCLEPVTAGGGVIEAPEGYWPRVQEICRKYDILLHIDEVVCGVGRTGTEWFGYQHYGIEPDFVTMAKGVASGYAAIACCVTSRTGVRSVQGRPDGPFELLPRHLDLSAAAPPARPRRWPTCRSLKTKNLLDNTTLMGDAHESESGRR